MALPAYDAFLYVTPIVCMCFVRLATAPPVCAVSHVSRWQNALNSLQLIGNNLIAHRQTYDDFIVQRGMHQTASVVWPTNSNNYAVCVRLCVVRGESSVWTFVSDTVRIAQVQAQSNRWRRYALAAMDDCLHRTDRRTLCLRRAYGSIGLIGRF